ncbi:MAG: biotin--[acetyl-CoA-carboxylase] ligase [Actinomycetota bacterium]|nr:biotin--[acetyl-CoA-carboxylase] ligase [Actinomycetota bacterium]
MVGDLSRELIESSVRGRFGRPVRLYHSTDSTNERALEWLGEGAPEGALVVADYQSAGRGRRGRQWVASPGEGLLFSLILYPRGAALELLTTSIGVAVSEIVEATYNLAARIKWPNDVTVNSKKLAGILVESRSSGGNPQGCVAGIGVNVSTGADGFADELETSATSIRLELKGADRKTLSRATLLSGFLLRFEEIYRSLESHEGRGDVLARAAARSDVLGHEVVVRLADGSRTTGLATGLGPLGELRLRTDAGEQSLRAGEVERLREADG